MGKAKQAAQELKILFDRKPTIDSWSEDGARLEHVEGNIEFRDVHFRYPTRPEQPVLRGLNLTVAPGQYIALVGASGCGKSTTIQLLERFYDPLVGGIYVDGKEISSLNINDYRSYIALVHFLAQYRPCCSSTFFRVLPRSSLLPAGALCGFGGNFARNTAPCVASLNILL